MDNPSSPSPCCCCGSGQPGPSRRGFFGTIVAVFLGAVGLASPVVAGLMSVFSPLREKSSGGKMVRVTSLDSLPEDGTPRKFPVLVDHSDAWTTFRNDPVGAVLMRREGKKVLAFQASCPHAGCTVAYSPSENIFACPCHVGRFDLTGKRVGERSDSPRDLDSLEVEVRDGGEVWVKFENYQPGIANKVVQA